MTRLGKQESVFKLAGRDPADSLRETRSPSRAGLPVPAGPQAGPPGPTRCPSPTGPPSESESPTRASAPSPLRLRDCGPLPPSSSSHVHDDGRGPGPAPCRTCRSPGPLLPVTRTASPSHRGTPPAAVTRRSGWTRSHGVFASESIGVAAIAAGPRQRITWFPLCHWQYIPFNPLCHDAFLGLN